jgi:hypothetical protein
MKKNKIEELVQENGEVHLVVEEHEHVIGQSAEDYIGVRKGENYSFDENCIVVDDSPTTHYIPYDSIVYAHTPGSFPD